MMTTCPKFCKSFSFNAATSDETTIKEIEKQTMPSDDYEIYWADRIAEYLKLENC